MKWSPLVLPLLYAIGIFIVSSLPAQDLPDTGIVWGDKAIHALAFSGLGFLTARGLRHALPSKPAYSLFLAAFFIAAIYGVIDEIHQSFVPSRQADVLDAVADTIGAGLGVLTCALWMRNRGQLPHS